MRALQTARAALALALLCLACGASATIALAHGALARSSAHRAWHTARACRHAKHRLRCAATHAGKRSHRRHGRHVSTKSSGPSSTGGSSGTATPTPSAPTGASGSQLSSPVGEVPPVATPPTPVAPTRVEVTAEDSEAFRFVLSRPSVPAGKVIIEFVNHGQDEHNLNAVEPSEGTVAGSLPNTAPNAHPSLTLNLHPGSYTLFCSLPGHEAKGMKATLVVN